MDGEDAEAIKAKTNALAQASMKLGEAMYKATQAGADGRAPARRRRQAKNDDVVDADFEEVDDDDQKKSA